MEENKYFDSNKKALARFKEVYPDVERAFYERPNEAINYLRAILGFRCAKCGGKITAGGLEKNKYQPDTLCFDCWTSKLYPNQKL